MVFFLGRWNGRWFLRRNHCSQWFSEGFLQFNHCCQLFFQAWTIGINGFSMVFDHRTIAIESMVLQSTIGDDGFSMVNEKKRQWTGKGRKASESLYQPKNTELFWTIFYISSTISLQYDRKGPEFLKIYKVRWSWVWSRGRNKFDIFY